MLQNSQRIAETPILMILVGVYFVLAVCILSSVYWLRSQIHSERDSEISQLKIGEGNNTNPILGNLDLQTGKANGSTRKKSADKIEKAKNSPDEQIEFKPQPPSKLPKENPKEPTANKEKLKSLAANKSIIVRYKCPQKRVLRLYSFAEREKAVKILNDAGIKTAIWTEPDPRTRRTIFGVIYQKRDYCQRVFSDESQANHFINTLLSLGMFVDPPQVLTVPE